MSKIRLKTTIIAILLVILSTTALSFATPTVFTDIEGYWAKEYIEDVYNRQIIEGYPDATFEPKGEITKPEAIVTVARLMDYSDDEGQWYIDQYKQKLESNNVPSWAQGEVAYALFNDILLEDELKSLISASGRVQAKRHEVATYIGRVLRYGAGEELGKTCVLPYIDAENIPNEASLYINLLLNKGILDETSNDRRFLPNEKITRAEVAKLVSLSAKILDNVSDSDIDVELGPIIQQPEDIVRKTVTGHIDNIIFDPKNIISIESENSRLVYEINSGADINIDGKIATVRQLQIGQEVTVIVEDNIVIDVKAFSNKNVLKGYFCYHDLDGQIPKVFIKDDKDKIHDFLFTDNSRVYFSDKLTDIKGLSFGDMVTITYVDDEIIKIEAEPKEKIFEGVVRAKNDSRDEYSLEVLLDDDTVIETFIIGSKAKLIRDKRSAKFEDIKVGDEVEISTEYGTVSSVNAFSVRKTVKGYIKRMIIGQKMEPTEIIVEKFDGTAETFILTPDTTIRVEEKRAGIYDLRLNYEVELEIENDEVSWLEAYRSFQGSVYVGKVTYMNVRREVLELQIRAHEEIEVHVDDETIYNDEFGDLIEFRDIYVDDEIVIVVEDDSYETTAKRVMVIIRR
ncbi:MAG TPA: S-layer homology domain-containing protein [Oscillospiraceae bacterium]|nr:S-layer homology domain-containing protein [Oscillospiraceae bacterium]